MRGSKLCASTIYLHFRHVQDPVIVGVNPSEECVERLVVLGGRGSGNGKQDSCKGRIDWAEPPQPPPPTPTPQAPTPAPAPTPQPRPTAICPKVDTNCTWQHYDLSHEQADDWSQCCAACHATEKCSKWVFHTHIAGGLCKLHSNAATVGGGDATIVCGTAATSMLLLETRLEGTG